MQSQEHIYQTPEPERNIETVINTDPREQQGQQQEYLYQSYAEGYGGSDMGNIRAREREKLHPRLQERRGTWEVPTLIAVLCVLAIAGSISGIIVSWLSWLILSILISVGVTAMIANWRVVAIPILPETFQVSERPMLVIKNSVGAISLRRGEEGVVSVAGVKRASGLGIKPDSMKIINNQQGNILNINGRVFWDFLQFGLRKIDLEITVPASCDIELENGAGLINVQGVNGTFKMRTGSGKVIVGDLEGRIEARTGSGRIEARKLEGLINLHSGSSRIEFTDLSGQVNLHTGSGRIQGNNIRGQINAHTGSGRVELLQADLRDDCRLKTGSGSIIFTGSLNPRGNYQMITGSGGINVTLPTNSTFSLKASTGSGGVTNEFNSNDVGTEPRPQLRLKTGSGGIRIFRSMMFRD